MTTLIYDDTLDFSDTQAMTDAGFTQHLFVDWPPSMPSTPLPRRSYSEELEQQPDDDYWNLCRRIHADIRAENNRKAEALGFASWEEKESHDEEENRKWLEDYIREHGHPPPSPVYTEEEEAALKLQYERSLELERAKLGPEPCNCEGSRHFNPLSFFGWLTNPQNTSILDSVPKSSSAINPRATIPPNFTTSIPYSL